MRRSRFAAVPLHHAGFVGILSMPRHPSDDSVWLWMTETRPQENFPFIVAGSEGGSINTGRSLPHATRSHGDLHTTLLARAGIPLDRAIGIATKQINEMIA